MTKTCKRCLITKDLAEFYRHEKMADGYLNFCKDCVRQRVGQHRADNDHVREAERGRYRHGSKREQVESWKAANKDRMRIVKWASQIVRRAVKKGEIAQSDTCEQCGQVGYTEGAHHDYAKPLEVTWLCQRCHRKRDQATPRTQVA